MHELAREQASLLLRFRLHRGFLEGLAENESGHLRCWLGRDLDLLPGERISPHVRSPRRSYPDKHFANSPERDPFAAHDADTDNLEQVFQDLLHLLADKAILLRNVVDQRCASELVRDFSRYPCCWCFRHDVPLPLELDDTAHGRTCR